MRYLRVCRLFIIYEILQALVSGLFARLWSDLYVHVHCRSLVFLY